ncbi:hypothetical protein ACFGVR_15380 [Mucilaginibacter sp. AW1-3]
MIISNFHFKFVIWSAFLLSTSRVLGQNDYRPNKIIPPSPTAAALGTYGDVPVSYNTGKININIPLYDARSGDVSIPVSLQYDASGVRVAQDASWVGLGWSLNCGGVITRSIRGVDDFDSNGYMFAPSLPDPANLNSSNLNKIRDIVQNGIDGEPDIFFYNFGKDAGKFVMGKQADGSPVLMQNKNNLKINYIPSERRWIIVTADGTAFYFGTSEKSTSYSNGSQNTALTGLSTHFTSSYHENTTAWYLDSIRSVNNHTVRFYYDIGESLSLVSRGQTRYDFVHYDAFASGIPLASVYNYFDNSRQAIHDIYLRKVAFDSGYLLFDREERQDIERNSETSAVPQKLAGIELYNNANVLLKHFSFYTSYFTNGSSTGYNNKRLKLDSVSEFGQNNEPKSPYRFAYFEPNALPDKYSRQVDNWGYPSVFYSPVLPGEELPTLLSPVKVNSTMFFPGATRPPDTTGLILRRGTLSSITYPTGGHTVFEFEPQESRPFYYGYNYRVSTTSLFAFSDPDSQQYQLTSGFDLAEETAVTFTPSAYVISGSETLSPSQYIGYLKNSGGTVLKSFNMASGVQYVVLPLGHYTIEVNTISNYNVHLFAEYDVKIGVPSVKGGGQRIRSIRNFDHNGKNLSAKRFVYTQNGLASGLSSGHWISRDLNNFFAEVNQQDGTQGDGQQSSGQYLCRTTSSTISPGFSAQGNPIGYDKVTVLEGENGEGGRTEYNYFNTEDVFVPFPGFPATSNTQNGQLDSVVVKNSDGAVQKRTLYEYTPKESDMIRGLKSYHALPSSSLAGFTLDYIASYDNLSTWRVLSSEKEYTYLTGQTYSTIKNYLYDDPTHRLRTGESFFASDGGVISTTYKYPIDFSSQQPYRDMVDRHIISPVIELLSNKNSDLLTARRTEYQDWGNGIVAPVTVKSKKGGGAYDTRLRYYGYDGKGNMLSLGKEGDVTSSYVWGYGQTLPVIKADNVSVAELDAKVSAAVSEAGYPDLDTFLASVGQLTAPAQKAAWKNFNVNLRSKFVSANVSIASYAYDPLFGAVCETDGNSLSTFYEYDGLGRVTIVRDNSNNIIKTFTYQYRK